MQLSGAGASFFPLVTVTSIRAATAMGGYSTMRARAKSGERGTESVLAEIESYIQAESSLIASEPFLTEQLVRTHLPKIEKMQVGVKISQFRPPPSTLLFRY